MRSSAQNGSSKSRQNRNGTDFEALVLYVSYSPESVVSTSDAWEDGRVAADRGVDDEIVGIEVVGLRSEGFHQAAIFAHTHFLAFPDSGIMTRCIGCVALSKLSESITSGSTMSFQ